MPLVIDLSRLVAKSELNFRFPDFQFGISLPNHNISSPATAPYTFQESFLLPPPFSKKKMWVFQLFWLCVPDSCLGGGWAGSDRASIPSLTG